EAEQVELLRISFLVDNESGSFRPQGCVSSGEFGKLPALGVKATKSVENVQLAGDVEKGLMFVRTVNIDEPLADSGEQSEGGWRAVDELAVRAGGGEGAFQHQLVLFARLQTVFFEEGRKRRAKIADVKDRFHRTGVGAAAYESAVGSFTKHESQSANKDR